MKIEVRTNSGKETHERQHREETYQNSEKETSENNTMYKLTKSEREISEETVSYTHLDVYKRQTRALKNCFLAVRKQY